MVELRLQFHTGGRMEALETGAMSHPDSAYKAVTWECRPSIGAKSVIE